MHTVQACGRGGRRRRLSHQLQVQRRVGEGVRDGLREAAAARHRR